MARQKTKLISSILRIAIDAMLAALYIALAYLTIEIGNIHITAMTLAIIVCAMLYSPIDAAVVGLLGEFIMQLLGYGLTPTTILWILPPAIYGALLGVMMWICRGFGRRPEKSPMFLVPACFISALVLTGLNTLVQYLDAIIVGYSAAYIFVDLPTRILVGLGTAILLSVASMPIVIALRRSGFGTPVRAKK